MDSANKDDIHIIRKDDMSTIEEGDIIEYEGGKPLLEDERTVVG